MFTKRMVSTVMITVFLFFSACSSGGDDASSGTHTIPPAKEEVSYELEQGTIEVEPSETQAMIVVPEINASNYQNELDFRTPNSGVYADYEVGDTLMSGVSEKAPNGYLRKITKIQEVGGELVITTKQGVLLEATNNIHIDYSSSNITPDDIKKVSLRPGVTLENIKLSSDGTVLAAPALKGGSLFDISIDQTFTHSGGDVTVKGRTTFDFGIIFKLETEYLVIPEYFKTSIVIDQGTKIAITSNNGIAYDDKISLGSISLAPITIGPVVIVPKIYLALNVDGQIQANFALSASESFHGEVGVEYKRGRSPSWKPIHEKESQTDYALPNLDSVNARIKANAGPEFSLMVYGVVGPYMFLSGFGEFEAHVTTAPNLDLHLDVGVEYELGVKVEILWIDEDYELASDDLFRINVLKLDDEPIPDAIYLTDPMENEFILYGPAKIVTAVYSGTVPARVDFLLDDVSIGSDNAKPYEVTWDTNASSLGAHTLKVTSYDSSGAVMANDSATIDLREAKWREGSVGDVTIVGNSDFSYGTGVVFAQNDHYSVIKETTDGGKTWSVLENKLMGLALGPITKGVISPQGIIGLEALSTDLYKIDSSGRTQIFDGFAGDNSGIFELGLNSSGDVFVILHKDDGTPYISNISDNGDATDIAALKDNDGWLAALGTPSITFSKVSEDAIVFDMKAVNTDTGAMNSGFMISHNSGDSWVWKDFNGADFGFLETIDGACFISKDEIVLVGTKLIDATDYDAPVPSLLMLPNGAFVVKTTDGGATWNRTEVTGAKSFSSVTFFNDKEGFASVNAQSDTPEPKVYKTEDAGLTWSPVEEVSTKERIIKVQFSNEYSGMAVGDEGTVFRFALD